MKKSLSLVVTGALVTSVFASSAFAAELTTQQKFDALKAAGIVEGYPGGSAGLDKNITRAEISKVVALLQGLGEDAASSKYKDVAANYWAKGYIGAVTKAGIVNGLGNNLFGPTQNVTVEQVAKIIVESAGLTPKADAAVSGAVSAWAKGYVAAAIEAGLIDQQASYKVAATRGQVFEAAYDLSNASAVSVKSAVAVDEKNIEVTFSDGQVVKQALTTALVAGQATKVDVTYNGKTYSVEVTLQAVKATEAAQTGAKSITVKFSRALSATEQTYMEGGYTLKSNLSTFPVTAKYADDSKSAVLSAAYLPAGDYTLTVKGTDASFPVKIVAAVASSIDITNTALQLGDNVDAGVKVYNQFKEEITVASSTYIVTAVNTTRGTSLKVNGGAINVKNEIKNGDTLTNGPISLEGDSVSVSAVYPAAGLTVNKVLKVTTGSTATSVVLGQVAPLKDQARVSAGDEGLVLPLTLKDAEGKTVKLKAGNYSFGATTGNKSIDINGLLFFVSDLSIIDAFNVDTDGVITFTAKKEGTVFITVTNMTKAGASASLSLTVNGAAVVKSIELGQPNKLIVAGEEVAFPFVAADTYGNEIKGTALKVSQLDFSVTPGLETGYPRVNAKGELVFKFKSNTEGAGYIITRPTTPGGLPNTLSITVNKAKTTVAVNGIQKLPTTLELGASKGVKAENIVLVDQYGRTFTATEGTYGLELVNASNGVVTLSDTGVLTAVKAGSAQVRITSPVKDAAPYVFSVSVVESDAIKTYEIDAVGTVYGGTAYASGASAASYQKSATLIGKTASGAQVVLKDKGDALEITSSTPSILARVASNKFQGVKAGKSTITAFLNGTEVAKQEVTVSEDAPIAATVAFDDAEYDAAATAPQPVVKDQYGVVINGNGKFYSSNDKIFKVTTAGAITKVAVGQATLTYITSNGLVATTIISVN
ncbi:MULTISPECIES: S-layer homology domain-containing protein [unclassified Paenibacillus]|uniref:S-layer homology domain-containing protein n=1 Tax=unclassified Paenibacillus TaxID=185978 RepID=UPI000954DBD6|nr:MULTISPECIES: S-layer homology domain-containing protein [unclassified Paenibacillus]ASS67252.2 S-layer homology domain-containing protein [Paenibacillus sp. RUD330]SIQ84083.1 S-layer homology domain-containing protein [Paenibacillus sp. RU4X]SIR04979.1 S-layer homology domain-containing protein [Paenibacillus sp. RU4T]